MSYILDEVYIERMAGCANTQALVDGEVSPPVGKPDIALVLSVDGMVNMGNWEVLEDRLMLEGTVSFRIAYACAQGNIYGFESISNFRHSVDMDGLEPGMSAEINPTMAQVEYTLLDNRRMQVKAIVDIESIANKKQALCAVQGMEGIDDIQTLSVKADIPRTVSKNSAGFVIREDVRLPQGMPPPREILWSNAYARIKRIIPDGSKIIVEGEIKITAAYCADGETQLWQANNIIPFEQMINIDIPTESVGINGSAKVKESFITIAPETEGLLNAEIILSIDIEVSTIQEYDLITDAYSPSMVLELETNTIELKKPCVRCQGKCTVREPVSLPDGMPPVGRVLMIYARPLIVNEYALQGKIAIEGIIVSRIIYLCRDGNLNSFSADVPFGVEMDADGVDENMLLTLDANMDASSATGTGTELEVRITLDINALACTEGKYRYVSGINQSGPTPVAQGGLIIYFAGKDETLWSIAKRFNTTIESLLKYNDIGRDDDLEGKKLLLFRPYSMH